MFVSEKIFFNEKNKGICSFVFLSTPLQALPLCLSEEFIFFLQEAANLEWAGVNKCGEKSKFHLKKLQRNNKYNFKNFKHLILDDWLQRSKPDTPYSSIGMTTGFSYHALSYFEYENLFFSCDLNKYFKLPLSSFPSSSNKYHVDETFSYFQVFVGDSQENLFKLINAVYACKHALLFNQLEHPGCWEEEGGKPLLHHEFNHLLNVEDLNDTIELALSQGLTVNKASHLMTELGKAVLEEKEFESWKQDLLSGLSEEKITHRELRSPMVSREKIKKSRAYTKDQLKLLENIIDFIFLVKNKEKEKFLNKKDRRNILMEFLEKKEIPLSIKEKNDFFVFLKKTHQLDDPCNPSEALPLKNAASQEDIAYKMRQNVLQQMKENLKEEGSAHEKIAFLKEIRALPIFYLHRNDSIFDGAFGRTNAVKEIDDHLKKLELFKKAALK
ncbi:MAG: hypothetical protein K0S27_873 [Gammaproteobacteria bacterium]|jgi:hypothetical protein|nr:hypothetical protein [Gammaproteobacteria bacterium]